VTTEDVKDVARSIVGSLGGTPVLLFLLVVIAGGLTAMYFSDTESRDKFSRYLVEVEGNRHAEMQGCFETIRSCQGDLAAAKGVPGKLP